MKLFKKVSENRFEINESDDSLLVKLMQKIQMKYPNVSVSLDEDSEGNTIIDVDTGETNFYISQKLNGKFSVNAVWPNDEKGKRNLDADKMTQAVSNIPGMT